MHAFLRQHITYPKAAQEARVAGVSVLQFVVEKDGSVTDIETVRSLSPETDKEAIRVLHLTSGNWKPGMQNGKPMRVIYTLSVAFTPPS